MFSETERIINESKKNIEEAQSYLRTTYNIIPAGSTILPPGYKIPKQEPLSGYLSVEDVNILINNAVRRALEEERKNRKPPRFRKRKFQS